MIQWPPDTVIPQRMDQSGYQFTQPRGGVETPMDRGAPKTFGGGAGSNAVVTCQTHPITLAEVARIRRFWAEDTKQGRFWFLMPEQQLDGSVIEGLANNFGVMTGGSYHWYAKFMGPPTEVPVGGTLFQVSMQLRIRMPS